MTNYYQTQCFSTHLTTFTSSFLVLPLSVHKNEIIYQMKDEFCYRTNFTHLNQLSEINKYKFANHMNCGVRWS